MQRYLPVGRSRVQVVSGLQHDSGDARRVAAVIEQMRPATLILDRSRQEWAEIGRPDTFQRILIDHLGGLPDALWTLAHKAARSVGAEVVLLHGSTAPPPNKGLRRLRKLLRREGMELTGDGRNDTRRLFEHYVTRTELWPWVEERRDRSAARLRAALEGDPRRALVVFGFPDGDVVCDRVQALGDRTA